MHRALPLVTAILLSACATATVTVKSGFDFRRVNRVAVISFTDYPGMPGSGGLAAGAFEQGLLGAGYDVMERASIDQILKERRLTAVDSKTAKELGKLLGVDALLLGRVTGYIKERATLITMNVVDEHMEPVYVKRHHRREQNGGWIDVQENELQGYKTRRVARKEPRWVTAPGQFGVSARLVYVPTGEVLWSGSDVEQSSSLGDSAQTVADAILGAVKKTWPASRKP